MRLGRAIKPVRVVERALEILRVFLQTPAPLGVGEIARLTRIPKSTAYRVLLTLEGRGYLVRSGSGEKFELGPLLYRQPQPDNSLLQVARPVIDGLRDTCGETVGLHLLDGDERVCIAAAEGVRALRTSGRVGSRAPLYSGASARAIMAFLPAERWDRIIARTGLAPLTSRTITDPDQLMAELARIRASGHAVSHGEWDEAITSVAAPIFDGRGAVTGSINLSGPTQRFGEEKIRLLVGALKAAAAEISRRMQETAAPAARGGP